MSTSYFSIPIYKIATRLNDESPLFNASIIGEMNAFKFIDVRDVGKMHFLIICSISLESLNLSFNSERHISISINQLQSHGDEKSCLCEMYSAKILNSAA